MEFDHIGLITEAKQACETWVEATRVWVTDPETHPYRVEWLRFEPDTPVTGPVRDRSHIAFKVKDIEAASRGMKVLLAPFKSTPTLTVGFFESADGCVVEFMQPDA